MRVVLPTAIISTLIAFGCIVLGLDLGTVISAYYSSALATMLISILIEYRIDLKAVWSRQTGSVRRQKR